MNPHTAAFIRIARHPFKFRFFLLQKLPSAFFAGLRVIELDEQHSIVSVPYKWFTKNPFRSTYFACLSMAAEMSTGALAMAHLYKRKPGVSMLVVKMEAAFLKKATGVTAFTCADGLLISNAIEETLVGGTAQVVRCTAIGKNKEGESIAEFYFTWSFKARGNQLQKLQAQL